MVLCVHDPPTFSPLTYPHISSRERPLVAIFNKLTMSCVAMEPHAILQAWATLLWHSAGVAARDRSHPSCPRGRDSHGGACLPPTSAAWGATPQAARPTHMARANILAPLIPHPAARRRPLRYGPPIARWRPPRAWRAIVPGGCPAAPSLGSRDAADDVLPQPSFPGQGW